VAISVPSVRGPAGCSETSVGHGDLLSAGTKVPTGAATVLSSLQRKELEKTC
jgi:hypothetical protein